MSNTISFQPRPSIAPSDRTGAAKPLHWQAHDQVSFRGSEKKEKTDASNPEKEPWHWGQRFKNSTKGGWENVKRSFTSKITLGLIGLFGVLSLIPFLHIVTCASALGAIPLVAGLEFLVGACFNFKTDQQMAEKKANKEKESNEPEKKD